MVCSGKENVHLEQDIDDLMVQMLNLILMKIRFRVARV
jgi:hypothetical protein